MTINTKWPHLLVVGKPVTEEQADEILIRTNGWWWVGGNDRVWAKTVANVAADYGRPAAETLDRTRDLMAWLERLGMLDLEYLGNSRVISSYIGGPHGWCNWDGAIGCNSYNIGKWPSDEQVTAEWQKIAEAFPYLDLTAQCIDEEGLGKLAGQWRVAGGIVTHDPEPTELLAAPDTSLPAGWMLNVLTSCGERGVSEQRLRQAFQRVSDGAS